MVDYTKLSKARLLSNEAKELAIRFYIGEINEVQFNFLVHQNQFNKEAMLSFIEHIHQTGRFISFIIIGVGMVLAAGLALAFIYILLGR